MDSLFGGIVRLLRRRWYVPLVVLVLGAVAGHALGDTEVTSTEILHVGLLEQSTGALGLDGVPEVTGDAVALQADEDFKRSPDYPAHTASFLWDETGRSLTFSVTGASQASVVATSTRLRDDLTSKMVLPVVDSLDVATADLDSRVERLQTSSAAIDVQLQGLDANDPNRSVLVIKSADVDLLITNNKNRLSSMQTLREVVSTLVTSEPAVVKASAPGITSYIAGVLAAGALMVLAAGAWVLADHRIRRRIHIERAAPGVRSLGLIGSTKSGSRQIDAVVSASIKTFVHDAGLVSLVLFGVPAGIGRITALAATLQNDLGLPVVDSDESAAGAIGRDPSVGVGYVAVVQWGKTTEEQLSSAIADLHSVGGLHIATLMVEVPDRERSWAGAVGSKVDLAAGGTE